MFENCPTIIALSALTRLENVHTKKLLHQNGYFCYSVVLHYV